MCVEIYSHFIFFTHLHVKEMGVPVLDLDISMDESNTVVSAYTLYRHLQQYCSLSSIYQITGLKKHILSAKWNLMQRGNGCTLYEILDRDISMGEISGREQFCCKCLYIV